MKNIGIKLNDEAEAIVLEYQKSHWVPGKKMPTIEEAVNGMIESYAGIGGNGVPMSKEEGDKAGKKSKVAKVSKSAESKPKEEAVADEEGYGGLTPEERAEIVKAEEKQAKKAAAMAMAPVKPAAELRPTMAYSTGITKTKGRPSPYDQGEGDVGVDQGEAPV